MIEGRPILYQVKGGTVYYVAEDGAQVVHSWPSGETIVALVDGDKKGFEPNDILIHRSQVTPLPNLQLSCGRRSSY